MDHRRTASTRSFVDARCGTQETKEPSGQVGQHVRAACFPAFASHSPTWQDWTTKWHEQGSSCHGMNDPQYQIKSLAPVSMNDEENASGMVKIKGVWCGWHVAAARKDLTYGNLESTYTPSQSGTQRLLSTAISRACVFVCLLINGRQGEWFTYTYIINRSSDSKQFRSTPTLTCSQRTRAKQQICPPDYTYCPRRWTWSLGRRRTCFRSASGSHFQNTLQLCLPE
jgi:hypothetical protein